MPHLVGTVEERTSMNSLSSAAGHARNQESTTVEEEVGGTGQNGCILYVIKKTCSFQEHEIIWVIGIRIRR